MQAVYRQAVPADISQIQVVRHSVMENRLSDPSRVTDADCEDYLTRRGRGWVCQLGEEIIAFAIVDVSDYNVWALFVKPAHEKKGIGKKLMALMLDWYFSRTTETLWLSTGTNTRAEQFYRQQGWQDAGMQSPEERRFEMTYEQWQQLKNATLNS